MAEVLFYQLERQSLEDVLPPLLEKTLARGWRAVVEVSEEATRDALNDHLWTYRDDSFLPHGTADDGEPARQPVYLTVGEENPNGAAVRFFAERAPPGRVEDYSRAVVLFSASDADAVAEARAAWKPLKAAGHQCTYWQQSAAGRWERKG